MSHPASPESSLHDQLTLALIAGIGPRLRAALLAEFTTPRRVLAASPTDLSRVPGVGPQLCRQITAARRQIDPQAELALCQQHGIEVLTSAAPCYPRLLQEIVDPPGVLFTQGTLLPTDSLTIAIVGARQASPYGVQQAERLATGLTQAGLTIVSGMARGIDAAAHRGALRAGGRTIAVLGSGLLQIYPPEHRDLALEIAQSGALISEMPPRCPPFRGAFPQRNRIVTGISLGVLVIEAGIRSGALISANQASEQGREVFAMPGRVDSRVSQGCHRLIRDGAKLVESVDDVLEELGPLVESATSIHGKRVNHPAELQLNEQEQAVLSAIDADPTRIEDIISTSQLPVHRVLSTLSVLEMRHLIQRRGGTLVSRKTSVTG
ncbi:MAG: DNA-processing protein DprA [Pirellulaceae bacterium]|nr:DNA-processing protein DprA [Pirellulaceae bacterium]